MDSEKRKITAVLDVCKLGEAMLHRRPKRRNNGVVVWHNVWQRQTKDFAGWKRRNLHGFYAGIYRMEKKLGPIAGQSMS